MIRHWTLRGRVIALCVVVACVLAVLAAGGATAAVANRGQIDTLLNKMGPVRTNAQNLLAALINQETGLRGYALGGEEADLQPYQDGLDEERRMFAEVRPLASQWPRFQEKFDGIHRMATEWRTGFAEPVIAAVRNGGVEAGRVLFSDAGRIQFDNIRRALGVLQDDLLAERNILAESVESTSKTLVVLIILAGAIILLAVIGMVLLLQLLVTRPVTDLAGQVRLVARGEYERKISSPGPPELTRLARDIDGMRKQISSDLAQVRQARVQVEEANARLEAQAAELTRSNRDLEQFAYVASHDLQEPLRKVASFCQLLQRRYAGQLDERADQYIAFAVNGAQRMQRLINDLLAFSRIGRVTSGFTDVDLDRVASEAASQFDTAREQSGAEITWSDLPVIRGEEPLLTNLLTNLISNAVKFRRQEEPPRVHISGRRVGDEWEITCADNGIGIETEFADKVFVIFQRLHAKDAYPGTGIGLAIAKKIVEYHGGHIWIDPDHRPGTAIRFTLPVAVPSVSQTEIIEPVEMPAELSVAADGRSRETVA